jgi:hypothetical protein
MGLVSGFIGSPIFWLIVYMFIIYYVLKIISEEVFGQPIGAVILNNRRVDFEDIDATDHMRLFKEQARAARFSKGTRPRYLYIKSMDPKFYSGEWAGMRKLGKIKGIATYESHHVVLFRKSWSYRKFLLLAPPPFCLSGTDVRNVIYEGTSIDILNTDWCYPVPSAINPWKEQDMRAWAHEQYRIRMKQMSMASLIDMGEYLLRKSAADTVEARMEQQQIADMMTKTESGEGEYRPPEAVMD